MTRTITIRIPVMVTADGKWAAAGDHRTDAEAADWAWLDETCDYDKDTINPTRMFVTVMLPLPPMITEVKATSVEAAE